MGIHCVENVSYPKIHTHAGREHHQDHGGKNTNIGQTHGILLHSIEHPRDPNKMLGLIVVVFPLFHGL